MCRILLTVLFAALPVFPQIGAPRLGFVRGSDGTVRTLHGVAASFTLGEPIIRNVERLWFDGRRGVALTATAWIAFDADGKVRRCSERAEAPAIPDSGAAWSADEVSVMDTGARFRLPFEVQSVERVGAEYILVRGRSQARLLRTTRGRESLYEIPEAAQ